MASTAVNYYEIFVGINGEWNLKGATLSDKTAKKGYGVDRDFVIKGIEAGKLEYRQG